MGKEDVNLKTYFKDARRYADLWNGTIFGGRQLVKADELEGADTATSMVFEDGSAKEKLQDVVMKQLRSGECLVTWILENQKVVDYSMPVRIMVLESMRYAEQVKKIQRRNRLRKQLDAKRKEMMEKTGTDAMEVSYCVDRQIVVFENNVQRKSSLNAGEYLYQFMKRDKLVPLTTLVVYWGDKEWDGPKSLHDMLRLYGDSELNEELLKLIPEYPMHIVNLATLDNTEGFQTELKLLFDLYYRRNDKDAWQKYIADHEECKQIDRETYQMLKVLTNSEDILMEKYENKEDTDMCKAIRDLIDDSKKEGREEGREEGIRAFVKSCKSLDVALEKIISALKDNFEISEEAAKERLNLYW